jgi:hypothetical protein
VLVSRRPTFFPSLIVFPCFMMFMFPPNNWHISERARIRVQFNSGLVSFLAARHFQNNPTQWVLRLCFRLRAALLYVGFHCLSLHVSAYMTIFRCVGFIYNGYCRLCLPLYAALLYVGFHCFSLHGHLQVCRIYTMCVAGYVSVCVQLYCMLVSTVFHYMFRPTWPSSSV